MPSLIWIIRDICPLFSTSRHASALVFKETVLTQIMIHKQSLSFCQRIFCLTVSQWQPKQTMIKEIFMKKSSKFKVFRFFHPLPSSVLSLHVFNVLKRLPAPLLQPPTCELKSGASICLQKCSLSPSLFLTHSLLRISYFCLTEFKFKGCRHTIAFKVPTFFLSLCSLLYTVGKYPSW